MQQQQQQQEQHGYALGQQQQPQKQHHEQPQQQPTRNKNKSRLKSKDKNICSTNHHHDRNNHNNNISVSIQARAAHGQLTLDPSLLDRRGKTMGGRTLPRAEGNRIRVSEADDIPKEVRAFRQAVRKSEKVTKHQHLKAVQAMKAVNAMKAMKVKKVYFSQNPSLAGYIVPVIPAPRTVADMNRRRVEQKREMLAMYKKNATKAMKAGTGTALSLQ